ncbi:hypothetical protein [Formosa algae]|uniref:Flap endonuclease-1-like 5' DNA nuclease n=1 Tax=Formosa algae TaxID=225843 RepID=A0A9X0YJV5_9FLAO|nr:hypothetical protein [Formosa algae]MBP1838484.1 putative flap endonuclease-1-like 5' DNA nuclease [Formosa algae]MDQ0334619.1 putative flap endonuclease-1-like 5' DNA nuclease [Formosa algae]OEI79151.1 LSU ribosomal protein L21p [Formosa algae]PNW30191.1 LSU ribosomal protein L21p [Formosa algae]
MSICILIPIIVGLLCALFGYLLGKASCKKVDTEVYTNTIAKLEGDLQTCHSKLGALEMQDRRMAASMSAPVVVFNASEAKTVFGKLVKENDLKIVEGIGPKIEQLFFSAGISTWKALSETSVEDCKTILKGGGEAYKIHNPGTWPEQAKLAYEGQWKKLLDWQDKLDGGK